MKKAIVLMVLSLSVFGLDCNSIESIYKPAIKSLRLAQMGNQGRACVFAKIMWSHYEDYQIECPNSPHLDMLRNDRLDIAYERACGKKAPGR